MRYQRYFIPLVPDSKGFEMGGKDPLGRCILEERGKSSKLSIWVQDLKAKSSYKVVLIMSDSGKHKGVTMGSLHVDTKGKGELKAEFDSTELADGQGLQRLCAVAVFTDGINELICPLVGFKDAPVLWKNHFSFVEDNANEEIEEAVVPVDDRKSGQKDSEAQKIKPGKSAADDAREKEPREKASDDAQDKESGDSVSDVAQEKEPRDSESDDVKEKELSDSVSDDAQEREPRDSVSDVLEKEPRETVIGETQEKEPGNSVIDGARDKEPEDSVIDGAQEKEPRDKVSDDAQEKEPGNRVSGDSREKEPGDSVSDGTREKEPVDSLSDDTQEKEPEDSVSDGTRDKEPEVGVSELQVEPNEIENDIEPETSEDVQDIEPESMLKSSSDVTNSTRSAPTEDSETDPDIELEDSEVDQLSDLEDSLESNDNEPLNTRSVETKDEESGQEQDLVSEGQETAKNDLPELGETPIVLALSEGPAEKGELNEHDTDFPFIFYKNEFPTRDEPVEEADSTLTEQFEENEETSKPVEGNRDITEVVEGNRVEPVEDSIDIAEPVEENRAELDEDSIDIAEPVEGNRAEPVEDSVDIVEPVEGNRAEPVEDSVDIAEPVEENRAELVEVNRDIAEPVEDNRDIAEPVEENRDEPEIKPDIQRDADHTPPEDQNEQIQGKKVEIIDKSGDIEMQLEKAEEIAGSDPEKINELTEIFKYNIEITPFDSKTEDTRWVRISLREPIFLSIDYRSVVNHPLIIAAYKKYNHLVLGQTTNDGRIDYVLGVPGIFESQYVNTLRQLGFTQFKTVVDSGVLRPGDYGYWLCPMLRHT